jgi:hypothetical protein
MGDTSKNWKWDEDGKPLTENQIERISRWGDRLGVFEVSRKVKSWCVEMGVLARSAE